MKRRQGKPAGSTRRDRSVGKSAAESGDAGVEVAVVQLGAQGDGIAALPDGAVPGRRVFVPGTVPGDRVRVRLDTSTGEQAVRGRLVALVEPGPDRQAPACRHFGRCGGCALQHVAETAYRAWKHSLVVEAVRRAGFAGVAVPPMAPGRAGTRRRARLAARRRGAAVTLGFQERFSHLLVDLAECPILSPVLAAVLPAFRRALAVVLAEGETADLVLTLVDNGIDAVLVGPATLGLAAREGLAVCAEAADLARLSWQPSAAAEPEPVAVRRTPVLILGDCPVAVPPGAFLQPTADGERTLAAAVMTAVGGAGGGRVADLFGGIGTFGLPLARTGAEVLAVDGDRRAVAALAGAARRAGLPLVADCRDLAHAPITARELSGFGAVVLDPPRAGAARQCALLAAAPVATVVAVSCNPATWSRDARLLAEGGFRLDSVQPVDQFLWSPHVELVSVFRRA